jgi:hypothetical protein
MNLKVLKSFFQVSLATALEDDVNILNEKSIP